MFSICQGMAEAAILPHQSHVLRRSFAISLGRFFWLLIAEIYPLKIRGLALESRGTNWIARLCRLAPSCPL